MGLFKKKNPRRDKVKKNIAADRQNRLRERLNYDYIISGMLVFLFVALCVPVVSFERILKAEYVQLIPVAVVVLLISLCIAIYIGRYQKRIVQNHTRALALLGLFVVMLATAKTGVIIFDQLSWITASAVAAAIVLSLAYDQRFAIGMSVFYSILAAFTAGNEASFEIFLTVASVTVACCLALDEIRSRMKLLEVTSLAGLVVFVISVSMGFVINNHTTSEIFVQGLWHAIATVIVGLLIQSLLPGIEKVFRIATSMTLLDYSDASQPLLRRLAMEAPGTFSHSLLVGSIAEAAAEAINRNGLLCRVGAYYHDIGKINKPDYFIENEMGSASKHKQLSPTMSQLVIVGHVKDGIEMAKEYKLPAVIRQFIETHHGKTLVEYFYNEAKQQSPDKKSQPSESEFRYTGPKPRTKEASIVMLADAAEGAVRSLPEITPPKIDGVVHKMAMKRLQDGQFDECDLTLRELSQIEKSISKSLAAHYHGRVAYPDSKEDDKKDDKPESNETENDNKSE